MKSLRITIAFFLPVALLLTACGGETEEEKDNEEVYQSLVVLQEVEQTNFEHQIRVQGNIETDQDVLIIAEMSGLITSVNVKEGQKVSKGQVIAQVDASILSSNMKELETQLEFAQYMLDKQIELNERGVGSEFDLEAAKNQVSSLKASMGSVSTQQGKASIRAPFSGVIDQVFAKQGQMASPAGPIVRLVNNSTVDIIAGVSEKHFSNIKEGTPILVSFPNYSDTTVELLVTHVGNYIEPTNRTFRIKSTIKNNDFFLPNMLAEVSITDLKVEDGIVVPSESVLKDQNNMDFVFTATLDESDDSKGKELYIVNKVEVTVIERFEGKTLLAPEDVKAKQLIVVKGARGIAEGEIVGIKH